jgi:alcohol dehydrogenase (cytochrome c)
VFRGTQDGRVLAYDFKTGRRMWEATIADAKLGESVPSAPIAWDGLVFVGNAGGDFKGGKGRMYALEAKTGQIVWEFFLVPRAEGEASRGPQGATPLNMSTWQNAPGIPISGGGTWTSYTLDPNTGLLYLAPVRDDRRDFPRRLPDLSRSPSCSTARGSWSFRSC